MALGRSITRLQTPACSVVLRSVGRGPPPAMTGLDGGGAAGDLHPALIRTDKTLRLAGPGATLDLLGPS